MSEKDNLASLLAQAGAGLDLGKQRDNLMKQVEKAQRSGHASGTVERVVQQIREFQAGLKEDEEVGAHLAYFGREVLIQVAAVGYHDPHLIVIFGTDNEDGQEVRLVQHLHQFSMLLKVIKVKPGQTARRIGFGQIGE